MSQLPWIRLNDLYYNSANNKETNNSKSPVKCITQFFYDLNSFKTEKLIISPFVLGDNIAVRVYHPLGYLRIIL